MSKRAKTQKLLRVTAYNCGEVRELERDPSHEAPVVIADIPTTIKRCAVEVRGFHVGVVGIDGLWRRTSFDAREREGMRFAANIGRSRTVFIDAIVVDEPRKRFAAEDAQQEARSA